MTARNSVAFVCVLVLTLTAPLAAQRGKTQSVDWPWGEYANGSDATSTFHRLDLYNLGLLGAKAWDAARPEPGPPRSGGTRRFSRGKPGGDDGPKRLIVKALLGGGPAQRAGLLVDDVLLGVDQATFAAGCHAPLAAALQRAEAGKGVLMLSIERAGKPLQLKVKLPKGGKDAADPVRGKHRAKIIQSALKWLADRQSGDGGFPQTLGGMNGRIANTSLAGLAWIAGGSSQRGGKHRANLLKAVSFVRRGLYAKDPFAGRRGGGGNWNQTTWAFAHAADPAKKTGLKGWCATDVK